MFKFSFFGCGECACGRRRTRVRVSVNVARLSGHNRGHACANDALEHACTAFNYFPLTPRNGTAIRCFAHSGYDVAHRVSMLCALLGGIAAAGLFRALAVSPFGFLCLRVRVQCWESRPGGAPVFSSPRPFCPSVLLSFCPSVLLFSKTGP